jgi:hypothetical protein
VTGRDLIIEAPGQRSSFLRWRDRGLTLLLSSAWSRPVDALVQLTAGAPETDGGFLWDAFLRDLGDASSVASVLIVLLYAWGGYGRFCAYRTLSAPPPTVPHGGPQ